MLTFRTLDDQTYEEIVEQAKGRLPWLCPTWTDHNAHDPGITLLELMAWYKELQQYHMDQLTPSLRRALLKLAGVVPGEARAAECLLEIAPGEPGRLLFSTLSNEQETHFELLEPIPERRPELKAVLVEQNGSHLDVGNMMDGGPGFSPFAFGGKANSALYLGFAQKPEGMLRLWFDVAPPRGRPRNPASEGSLPPRTLEWSMEGCGIVEPVRDDTWALSWSGFVTLEANEGWTAGEQGMFWLSVRQNEPGCEEQVRLSGISAGRYRAAQQESRVRSYAFRIAAAPAQQVHVASEQSLHAELAVFRRADDGWEQLDEYSDIRSPMGRLLEMDGAGSAQDGMDNLLVVCLNPLWQRNLLFDAKGLPGEQFYLNLSGQKLLTGHLSLMCMTLERDGAIRPAIWKQVDDLAVCGPRDRVFRYDPARETVVFGDGAHGALVAPGEGAVMVTELVLSLCGAGNVPENAGLWFQDDRSAVNNGAASGGRDAETLDEARGRLLVELERTVKCESAEDFEQCAVRTPGLRVAGARALPGYDVHAGRDNRRAAHVTVVVLPESERALPMPDERFLASVNRQLERYRPICIHVEAAPPRYVPVELTAELMASTEAQERELRQRLHEWLAPRAERVGQSIRRDDAAALLQKLPGVLQVRRLELRGLDQNSYQTAAGDIQLPPDGLPDLQRIALELRRV